VSQSLQHFLNPQSVAVIGVSPNESYIHNIFRQLLALQTPPAVYPINPHYPAVANVPCYPRLGDVPDDIELVLVSVPARLVPDALEQCTAKRVRAVNIISSGFAELGGAEGARRHQLVTDFVAQTGIRVVGPNCYGNASAIYKFAGMPDTATLVTRPGRLSLAFQSGGIAVTVVANCLDRHMDVAHVVTTGNEADVDVSDCVRYFADDEHTRVIGCYVEQFRKPQAFLAAAELCAQRRKPIVVLKSGRSQGGRQMAQAHTGALAGSDKIIDAVLRKYGVARVYDLNEFAETMAIMHSQKLPKGRGVAALTTSGGENAILMDLAQDIGVSFPPLAPDAAAMVRKQLYDYAAVTNPLDLTGSGGYSDQHVHAAALDALGGDPNIHIILHQFGANSALDAQSPEGKTLLSAVAKYPDKIWLRTARMAGTYRDKPVGAPDPIDARHALAGVPFMMGLDDVLKAVQHLIVYAEFQESRRHAHGKPSQRGNARRAAKARALVRASQDEALSESAGKAILGLYGIPTTRESLATSAAQAAKLAQAIGYPVAMKIVSPQIRHKTEVGGVALNIRSATAARKAFTQIMTCARLYERHAELQGVSVQEMVNGVHEMIVGMTHDPDFGPGIVLGWGGIFVEMLQDTVWRVPPLTADDARAMIDALKGVAILKGARGAKPADLDALVRTLTAFSQLCEDLSADVSEIDMNPVVVLPKGKGVRALDCLILRASGEAPTTRLADTEAATVSSAEDRRQ
jgi:acetyltransferase